MAGVMQMLWRMVQSMIPTNLFRNAMEGPEMNSSRSITMEDAGDGDELFFLSWRLAIEANNVTPFVPPPRRCVVPMENYLRNGQYGRDVDMAVRQIMAYIDGISPAGDDGKDAWVFDVDDTCLSNFGFFEEKIFGVHPFKLEDFHNWVNRGVCPPVPGVLRVYKKLIESGFKVFFITGREEEELGEATARNLSTEGFTGYERLILRTPAYEGQKSRFYKTAIRKQLVVEEYRIRGNIGDQWSDLLGDCAGDRTFKIPNPAYVVL